MKPILTAAIVALTLVTVVAQRGTAPAAPALPPISMTCVHHPDVLESRPGTCPFCKLPLVPVRLDSAWMCPVHTTATESTAGKCRICGRQLVPVTVSLTWTCKADRATEHLEPGLCADGSLRIMRRTLRAHGNHNPQHGGQFFMAPDNWHHLEGVHPSARIFRLYVYDDYGRPLPQARLREIHARVVTKETFDPATRTTTELSAFPLRAPRNRQYLEARIDPSTLPAEMTAKVRFGAGQPEYRFDFAFTEFSKEPPAPARRPSTRQPLAPPTSPAAAPETAPASSSAPTVPGEPAAPPVSTTVPDPLAEPIPVSMSGMLEQMQEREKEVGALIARGELGAVWVPAFRVKDIAIALEPHLAHLPSAARDAAEPALSRIVRTAWLLDAAGDVGNRAQVDAIYAAFSAAVADALAAFGGVR